MGILVELANEALGYVRNLPYLAAEGVVQAAWREIRDSRRWSFLSAEDVLIVPDTITAGTVTVEQFSNEVVGDATAVAAWAATTLPVLTDRQFRLGAGSPIYNITSFDEPSSKILVDRAYTEASGSGVSYEIYRCHYKTPVKDFLSWRSISNPEHSYRFRRRNLHRKREEIDRRDPQRTCEGHPAWSAAYKYSADGYPLYELWPHPKSATTFLCGLHRKGTDLTRDEELPTIIPKELLSKSVRLGAYEWALANNIEGNWGLLTRLFAPEYKEMLRRTQVNDEEIFPQNFSDLEDDLDLCGSLDGVCMLRQNVFSVE